MRSTSSADDGTFRLEAGPGFWSVTVASSGFAPWRLDHLLAGDDLMVVLDPEVLLLVSVVDPEGAPVAGAELVVHAASAASPEDWRCRMSTDPRGHAQTTALAPGRWMLSVRHPDHRAIGVPLEIPIGVQRVEKTVQLERGTRLAGTVRDEDGLPIAGARVRIESPYRNDFLWDELTCDEEGRYATGAIYSLQETLEVVASAPGFAESQAWVGIQPREASAGEAVQDFVLLRAGRTVRGRAIALGRGVPGASIRIAAIDPVGTSREDALMAFQMAPRMPWLWQESTRTDESGAFELIGLSAAPQYVLLVLHEGYSPRVVWIPTADEGSVTELADVELLACGSLFGRAMYADGAPAAGKTVRISKMSPQIFVASEEDLGRWRPDYWFKLLESPIEADGSFRFDLLDPGTYRLNNGQAGDIEVESGRATGPLEFVLPGAETEPRTVVAGVVRDAAGEPVPMVFVRALASGEAGERLLASGLVDATGAFSLALPIDSASRIIFIDLRGAHEDEIVQWDSTRSSEPLEVVLRARAIPLPPIDGLVLGPRGGAVEACTVTLHPPEDSLCACIAFHAKTDPAGAFRFSVSEGPHRLVASDPRFASATYAPAWPGDHVVMDLAER